MLTPWARTFIWRRGFLLWQFSQGWFLHYYNMIPPCSFEWGRKLPQHVEAQRWIQKRMISPVSSQMRDTSFFWIICPALWWFNELTVFFCWFSLQPSLNNKPMMFVSSFAPSSKLTFSPKFLGRWSSRKCYSHRFLRLAPTPVPDLVGKPRNAMFRLASWHLNAARLPMWQRSGRCLCCRLVDGVDIVFLPTEFDQAGAFSSRQEQFPAQKPSRWMVWLFINHIRTMAES